MIVLGVAVAAIVVLLVQSFLHRATVNSLLDAFSEERKRSDDERRRLIAATLARSPGEFLTYAKERDPRPKRADKPFVGPDEQVPVGL